MEDHESIYITINHLDDYMPVMNLKVGDILTVRFGANETKYEVLSISESVRKEQASEMYRIVS